jgi:glycosyltransferase involved in cell wall biosynthesis
MKKSILHITHTDVRFDSRILKEASALCDIGVVDVYALGIRRSEGSAVHSYDSRIKIETLSLTSSKLKHVPRFLRLIIGGWFWLALELVIRIFARGVRVRPTVVHCHDVYVLPAALLIKLFSGCIIVYDAHELESNRNGQKRLEARIIRQIEKLAWPRIEMLISVSPSIIDWYLHNFGAKKNILVLNSPVISCAISTPLAQSKRYFHDLYNLPPGKLVFVYLGLLIKGRGIDIYLSAFANSRVHSHVVFIGYGEMSAHIKEVSDNCDRVHLHPPVSHDEVVNLVASADAGLCIIEKVSLSDYYCLPNKLFEYAFAGLPVVASRFPDMEEVVSKYNIGICCDPTPMSLIETIENFGNRMTTVSNPDLQELSWDAQRIRLINAYQVILNN